jgi:excisionase family DNA binding protein
MSQLQLTNEQLTEAVMLLTCEVNGFKKMMMAMGTNQNTTLGSKDVFIGTSDAAKLLGIANQTVYDMVCANRIPYYKTGKKLQFLESELINWIKQSRKSTGFEINKKAAAFISSRENS